MTFDEFKKKIEEDPDWAPGWDAIELAMEMLYPLQTPEHFSVDFESRAALEGNLYLDGVSLYNSGNGYKHLVTYGMTELYANEQMFGKEKNKIGYEMTMKLKEDSAEKCIWAINVVNVLAKFTYTKAQYFSPMQFINMSGAIANDRETKIAGFITIEDTELDPVYSVYGETSFLQLFGITEDEVNALRQNPERVEELYNKVKEENPNFVTDLSRTKSYIELLDE